jgi:aminopeptidase N
MGGVLGSNAFTYLHELSHMWFGDAVTLKRWNDIWFNEGWAQLSEWEYGHEFGGDPTTPGQQFQTLYNDPGFDWSLAPAELGGDPANLFNGDATYARGGMVIEGYREIVGDATFFEFAKALQTEFAYGNISTAEFIEFAKEFSGLTGSDLQLLDVYFQQWLYGTVRPTILPDDFA